MNSIRSHCQFAFALVLASGCWLAWPAESAGQQVNVGGPFNSVGHSFYENIGTRWGVAGPGWFFNFGGGAPVAPPFGGFDPNAGAQFGAGFRAGNTVGSFNLNAGQGANSTFVSQTPNVTIPNGGNGVFIDGTFRPFVTSIIPVVGDNSDPSPLRERLRRLRSGQENPGPSPGESTASTPAAASGGGSGSGQTSSADRGALSVAAIKAQAAAEEQAAAGELAVLLEKAKGAEEAGKPTVAKLYYQMAARRATGEQQREIQARIQALQK